MYFPVADIDVNPLLPSVVTFGISFFTSMAGLSGAFLLLPFQMSVLGFSTPAVSSTNQLYNLVAIPSGVWRYIREGRMVWPLCWVVVLGTLPGVFVGALLRIYCLPDPGQFQLFAGLVLLFIGTRLASGMIKEREQTQVFGMTDADQKAGSALQTDLVIEVQEFSMRCIRYRFLGEAYRVPCLPIFLLSTVAGVVGGTYGIGGGAIIAPVYVAFYRLPVYTIAGATLMGTWITSIAAVLFFQLLALFHSGQPVGPDWILGLLFGLGGLMGMYAGARLQKFVPAGLIKFVLVLCLAFISAKYLVGFWIA